MNIRIDANQGWTPAMAVQALKSLEPLRVEFCEQPVPFWDWEGMKFVATVPRFQSWRRVGPFAA